MAYCMIQGKRMFYEELGDGRPLLLLPGDGVCSRVFEPVRDLYQKGRKLILVDYLDTGRSDRREELPQNPWQQAAQEVIADGFVGEIPPEELVSALERRREQQKNDPQEVSLLSFCHGEDWQQVLDRSTQAILGQVRSGQPVFSQPLERLGCPLLLAGSRRDQRLPAGALEERFRELSQRIPGCRVHLFDEGDHPSCLSNEVEFAAVAQQFLDKE